MSSAVPSNDAPNQFPPPLADGRPPADELVALVGALDLMNPNCEPEERAEHLAGVAHELGVELTAELVATLDEGWRYALDRAKPSRPPTHLRAEAERQLTAEGRDVSTAPAWLLEGAEDLLLEEEQRERERRSLLERASARMAADAAELHAIASGHFHAAEQLGERARLAASDDPLTAQLCLALSREARRDASATSARARELELASQDAQDWTSKDVEHFAKRWRANMAECDRRGHQWDRWTTGLGKVVLHLHRRDACPAAIRRRPVVRARRRVAARRAAGIRSGQDPGDEDPDDPSERPHAACGRATNRPRRTRGDTR